MKSLEGNKVGKPATTSEKSLPKFRLWEFIGDVKTEFKKVTWTGREELQTYTKIVVASTFVMGLGIYFADLIIQGWLGGLNTLFRWIGA